MVVPAIQHMHHSSISTEVRAALSVVVPIAIIGTVVISERRFKRRSGERSKKRSSIRLRDRLWIYKQASEVRRARKRGSAAVHSQQAYSSLGQSDDVSDTWDSPYNTSGPYVYGPPDVDGSGRIRAVLIINSPAPPRPDPVLGITTPTMANRSMAPAHSTDDDRMNAYGDLLQKLPSRMRHDDTVLRDGSRTDRAGTVEKTTEREDLPIGDAGESVDTSSDEIDSRKTSNIGKDDPARPDTDTAISINASSDVFPTKDKGGVEIPVQFRRGGGCDILVLGQVELIWFPENTTRRIVPELACFLVLHQERNMTGEEIRAALWPGDFGMAQGSAKSLRNAVSLLRKAIGNDMVPGASRGSGYSISSEIKTDWARFCEFKERSKEDGADEIRELSEALSLVRGTPFEGVESGYGWAWSELFVSQMEVAIISVARRLSSLAMENNDYELASRASMTGLSASPFDRGLWQDTLSAAAGYGRREIDRRWRDAVAVLGSDASDLSVFVESLRAEGINGQTG